MLYCAILVEAFITERSAYCCRSFHEGCSYIIVHSPCELRDLRLSNTTQIYVLRNSSYFQISQCSYDSYLHSVNINVFAKLNTYVLISYPYVLTTVIDANILYDFSLRFRFVNTRIGRGCYLRRNNSQTYFHAANKA